VYHSVKGGPSWYILHETLRLVHGTLRQKIPGEVIESLDFWGKFYKAKPKRKARTSGFWFAITRPNRVFQSQKVAQNAPLLPYFLEHEENLGSDTFWAVFSWHSQWHSTDESPTYYSHHIASKKCSTLLSHRAPRHHAAIRPITTSSASIWLNALVYLRCSMLDLIVLETGCVASLLHSRPWHRCVPQSVSLCCPSKTTPSQDCC